VTSKPNSFAASAPLNQTQVEDSRLKRQAISAEESHHRQELLSKGKAAQQSANAGSTNALGSDSELRRRLGLSTVVKSKSGAQVDIAKQLEADEKVRDTLETDVIDLLRAIKDNSLSIQKSLTKDVTSINAVDDLLTKNSEDVQKEIQRVDTLFNTTAMSCRANCALISFVLMAWIAVYIIMKITPKPA
jgi:hypothetical protein